MSSTIATNAASARLVGLTRRERAILDAIRGGAALYVVCSHAIDLFVPAVAVEYRNLGGAASLILAGNPLGLFGYGHYAVIVFFVLSGLVIHYRQAQHPDERHGLSLGPWAASYARKRIVRIYPPLLAALALTVATDRLGPVLFGGAFANPISLALVNRTAPPLAAADVALVLLPVGIPSTFGSNPPLWSLQYELLFYAAYPIVLIALDRLAQPIWRLLVPAVALGFATTLVPSRPLIVDALVVLFPTWLVGAALAERRAQERTVTRPLWGRVLASAALAAALIAANNQFPWFDYLFAGGVSTIFALLLRSRPHQSNPGVLLRLTAATATWSYSLYLVHYPIMLLLQAAAATLGPAPPLILVPLGVGVSVVAGLVFWWLIERPSMSLQGVVPKNSG